MEDRIIRVSPPLEGSQARTDAVLIRNFR